ncbi:MAG: hypothetical protein QUS33_14700 [Dehalococcoidia bacterium]|nr:hypothetical protein [Dehalococcoidia bacterium]
MLAPQEISLDFGLRSGTARHAPTMAVPMAVVTGSGRIIMATPAAKIPFLIGLRTLLKSPLFLVLVICLISHPRLPRTLRDPTTDVGRQEES